MINDYFIEFFIGGMMISLTTYISKNFNFNMASFFWSIPISIFVVIYYMNLSGKSNNEISHFIKICSYFTILSSIYLYILSKFMLNKNIITSIIYSSIIYILILFIIYYILYKH